MKMCLRQVFRPERPLGIKGVGDCTVCVPDEDNKNCKMFFTITIGFYTVSEKGEEDAIRKTEE